MIPFRSKAAVALALCAACSSTPDAARPGPESTEKAAAKSGGKDEAEKKALRKAYKEADRQHELAMARIDLEIAELESRAALAKAEREHAEAQRALAEAEQDLSVFLGEERPREIEKAVLGVDRADFQRVSEEDELAELEAMYAAEEFAQTTKELVLKRGRKGLEFAQRSLALERAELEHLKAQVLPKKERELTAAVEKARGELADAEAELAKARLEADKALAKARQRITVLERPLDDEDGGDEDGGGEGEEGEGLAGEGSGGGAEGAL